MITHKAECSRVKAIRERAKVLPECNCGGKESEDVHLKAQRKIDRALKVLNKGFRL